MRDGTKGGSVPRMDRTDEGGAVELGRPTQPGQCGRDILAVADESSAS